MRMVSCSVFRIFVSFSNHLEIANSTNFSFTHIYNGKNTLDAGAVSLFLISCSRFAGG
jgi:hypothetical protein